MPYTKSICVAGKTKEYEFYYSARYDRKGGSRRKKENRTPEAAQKVNRRNAEKRLTRILNANFDWTSLYVTLSYKKEDRPDAEGLRKDVRMLLKKLRKAWRKHGRELKYVWVAERGERGAVHIHLVINGFQGATGEIREAWKKGWICIKPLDRSGQYRRLANYFIKYSEKTMRTEERITGKRYCSSRNLVIPEPKKRHIRSRNAYGHTIEIPSGYYLDKDSVKEAWHEITGYTYFAYTLIQLGPGERSGPEEDRTYILDLETGETEIRERRKRKPCATRNGQVYHKKEGRKRTGPGGERKK